MPWTKRHVVTVGRDVCEKARVMEKRRDTWGEILDSSTGFEYFGEDIIETAGSGNVGRRFDGEPGVKDS